MSTTGSNAILAKARAMYGKRVTAQQYDELLKCKTVAEVATYLKRNTHFGLALSAISENNVHRGQLENILRRTAFDEYYKLYRYQVGESKDLFHYFVVEEEIVEILRMVLLLKAGTPNSFILDVPGHLISRTHIDLISIARVTSYDELIQVLGEGEYSRILKRFRPEDGEANLDYTGIEHALYGFLYRRLFNMANNYYSKADGTEFGQLLKIKLELLNLVHIYRNVVFLKTPKEALVGSLFHYHSKLTTAQIDALCEARSEKEFFQIFQQTYYYRNYPIDQTDYFEHYTASIFYKLCRHELYFTTSSEIAFYAYLSLHDTEQRNITNIIEGTRYQVPEAQIKSLLIY